MRGLPLSELVALRNKHRSWLETVEYNTSAKKLQRKTMCASVLVPCGSCDMCLWADRYDVVAHIIKPATAEEQISYSELGPSQALNYFVSHVSVCFASWVCFSVWFCSGGATNFATP